MLCAPSGLVQLGSGLVCGRAARLCAEQGVELLAYGRFNAVFERTEQKSQLRRHVKVGGGHAQLSLHAGAGKVQGVLVVACLIAAFHVPFAHGLLLPCVGDVTRSVQTEGVAAVDVDGSHGKNDTGGR